MTEMISSSEPSAKHRVGATKEVAKEVEHRIQAPGLLYVGLTSHAGRELPC